MKKIERSENSIKKEILCWVGFLLYLISYNYVKGTLISQIIFVVFYFANFAIAYYLLFLIVFVNFYENHLLKFVTACFAVILTFVLIDFAYIKILIPYLGGHISRGELDFVPFVRQSLFQFFFIAFAATSSYLSWRNINNLKRRAEDEKILLTKELVFLKNRFDSHLTFNFLNFCYSQTMIYSAVAANAIAEFSKMLRSALSNEIHPHIPLENEIEYIQQFICVQKCLTNNTFVNIHIQGNLSGYTIVSRMLSIFVENAFRHGSFNDEDSPIYLSVLVENDELFFYIKNKKSNQSTFQTEKLSLKNLRTILNMFYLDNFHLQIDDNNEFYTCELNLKLLAINGNQKEIKSF